MDKNDLDEKEESLMELAQTLSALSAALKVAPSFACYVIASAAATQADTRPVLGSCASSSFVTSDGQLTNRRHHQSNIATADGQTSFTESMSKYELTNSATPFYLTALSAPTFTQNLVSIGQLAQKHNVLCTKDSCYVLDPSTAPPTAIFIGVRGQDNLYRLADTPQLLHATPNTSVKVAAPGFSPCARTCRHTTR